MKDIMWGLGVIGLFALILLALILPIQRDKNLIREKSGEDSSYVFFHTYGKHVRCYKTTSGQFWVVSGIFFVDAFKQE